MNTIRLLDLGLVSPVRSQTVYHAVAHGMTETTPDTIILVSPDRPYVCIGYHQDLEKEVDLAYCAAHDLPVYRREVGGGAVYLDAGQVFLQWIFHAGHVPPSLEERFELFIRPLVATYQALGIPAYHRPVNDVHVSGKKIGGTGAAQMGSAEVLVGSLMFTFDKATMARVLKVASEKMRDKVFESLEQYMTTMTEQLGRVPDRQAVMNEYVAQCAAALDAEIVAGRLTSAEDALAAELDARFASDDWLYLGGRSQRSGVKIHEDVWVGEGMIQGARWIDPRDGACARRAHRRSGAVGRLHRPARFRRGCPGRCAAWSRCGTRAAPRVCRGVLPYARHPIARRDAGALC